jgi:hypothetical protein
MKSALCRQSFKLIGLSVLGVVLVGLSGWSVLALFYFDHLTYSIRLGLAVAYAVVALIVLFGVIRPRWRWRSVTASLMLFMIVLVAWSQLTPSNDRDWQIDVAVLPYAQINGDLVTVHNIRNFTYRSEIDYTPHYYDRTYDLRKLKGIDLIASYWMGPTIAHVFLSFDFADQAPFAISIETRKERGESYSTLAGFFREYELYYVVADERDVIRLRTNYRKHPPEEVYIYRLKGPLENARRLFLQYMEKINKLRQHPQWYNTLTTNCTTVIWMNTRINPGHLPFSWKILASGYVPEYLYEMGVLDTTMPFAELQRRSRVNARAQVADSDLDFSRQIRAGLPGVSVDDNKIKSGRTPP